MCLPLVLHPFSYSPLLLVRQMFSITHYEFFITPSLIPITNHHLFIPYSQTSYHSHKTLPALLLFHPLQCYICLVCVTNLYLIVGLSIPHISFICNPPSTCMQVSFTTMTTFFSPQTLPNKFLPLIFTSLSVIFYWLHPFNLFRLLLLFSLYLLLPPFHMFLC